MHLVGQQEQTSGDAGNVRQEFRALTSGCGVYRADRALLSLTGRDRVRWLNGMVSNNVRDLASCHGVYAFVLNPQGHILGDLYVFNRGESLVVEIERAQAEAVLQILRRYIIMDKVEIEDLSETVAVIGIAGPKADDTLAALGLKIGDLGPLQVADTNWNGTHITVLFGDNSCVANYELWVPKQNADSVLNGLLRAGAVEIRADALEKFRVVCGIPKVGQDIRQRDLPHETGQERALNFSKGCYIGQEIVERIRSRGAVHRALTGFEIEGPVPAAGTKIQSEGKDVGEITSVATVPCENGDRTLALGYMRKEFMSPDKELAVGEARIRATALPFSGVFS